MDRSRRDFDRLVARRGTNDHELAVVATAVEEPCADYVISRGDDDEGPPVAAPSQAGYIACLATCRERPRSEARCASSQAPCTQLHPSDRGVRHRSNDLARQVTPKKLLGFPNAFSVWPWTEHDKRISATRAIVSRPDEENRAGREPNNANNDKGESA